MTVSVCILGLVHKYVSFVGILLEISYLEYKFNLSLVFILQNTPMHQLRFIDTD